MTSQELKVKLDAAEQKLEARKNIISKVCKNLGYNVNGLLKAYYDYTSNLNKQYLTAEDCKAIVCPFAGLDSQRNYCCDPVYDILVNMVYLYNCEKTVENWKVKYETQKNKEEAPKIEAVWNFLCEWEISARNWYKENAKRLVYMMNRYHTVAQNFLKENNYSSQMSYEDKKDFVEKYNNYMGNEFGVYHSWKGNPVDVSDWTRDFDAFTKDLSKIRFIETKQEDDYYGRYDSFFDRENKDGEYRLEKFDSEKLDKTLAQEKLNKYYDLCNRITKVVGEITDASHLSIGEQHGELNGIVYGTKGNAKVETIGAGGYNQDIIVNEKHGQCFHYRVLVNKVK